MQLLLIIYLNFIMYCMIYSYSNNNNNNILKLIVNNIIKINKYSSFNKHYCNVNDININNNININENEENDIEITSIKPYITSGLLAVHKPKSRSSADIVSKIRYIITTGLSEKLKLPRKKCKVKVGHGGTLDPMAEGVLILGIGEGTKLLQDYLSGSKNYNAIAKLGSETDTLDNTGNITEIVDWSHINRQILNDSLDNFRGDIMQTPPMYSALRKNGKRLYELAREGKVIELEPRPVSVYSLELLEKNENGETIDLPNFGLAISCSGGFYVRSVISDIAKSIQTRAHMTALLRTKQGPFDLNDCLNENDWSYDKINEAIKRCSIKVGIN